MPGKLNAQDIKNAATRLGVPVAAVKAVNAVESAGSGFLADGRPKVLFERHVMFRRLRDKFGSKRAEELATEHPELINRTPGGYGKQSSEPDRMDLAAQIDRECALESASWGLFQIMGYHWNHLGYPDLQAFINAMYAGEAEHLDAFVRFIEKDRALHKALKALDWTAFARIYNGPNYAKGGYHTKLAAAYARGAE